MQKKFEISRLYLQLASVTDDGMHLELCNGSEDGGIANDGPYPLAWFRADAGERIKFEFAASEGIVSIPLGELERGIAAAKSEVRSEDHYD